MKLALALLMIAAFAMADPYGSEFLQELESSIKGPELCTKGGLAGRQSRQSDEDWDDLNVTLNLEVMFDTQSIQGFVVHEGRVLVPTIDFIELDFHDDMIVTDVALNGSGAGWSHLNHKIIVTASPQLSQDQEFVLQIEFEGSPPNLGWGSFEWYEHEGVMSVATLSEPENARGWWPCKDVPNDKFTADVSYRVPSEFSAPGNGLLQAVVDHGDGSSTWHWHESYPISTYLISMTVSNFLHYTDHYVNAEGDSIPIENYVWPEVWDGAQEDLSITPEAFSLMESLFGEYPFKEEKYGHAIFQWPGAMEHTTMTSYGWYLVGGSHYFDRILVHELAHSWFGNYVTLQDWENVWLNEGPAKYSEALWFEHRDGPTGLRYYMESIDTDFEGPVYNNPDLFGNEVYRKGAWVLHMLRGMLQDDGLFFEALRNYLSLHPYGNAHTTDFQAELEAYLNMDLEQYFQQWVYGVERPNYEWGWTVEEDHLIIRVDQVQIDTGLFEMPLHFRAYSASDSMEFRVDNQEWHEAYAIPLNGFLIEELALDPDLWLLKHETEVPYDPTSAEGPPAYPTAISGNYPNPFNPSTRVAFTLAERGHVRLTVHDAAGRRVATIVDGILNAGPQDLGFDARDHAGRKLSSGIYLIQLEVNSERLTHRILLLK
ncbi:T9SS type A sorting domain-containing protein [bacterium]|nr:T9SS type A sorting domain-containing protein [bacterium]